MKRILFGLCCVLLLAVGQKMVAQSLTWDAATSSIKYGDKSYKMVRVDGGTFKMGATAEQGSEAFEEEKPQHSVTLTDYYIGATEVPQWLWVVVMGDNPSKTKGDYLPVESVSWDDCQLFLGKLNEKTGNKFALPTEAQWEYAARGGNKSRGYKYAGSNNAMNVGWYEDNSNDRTQTVCKKAANELGLYDMSGNVNEWCNDWYAKYSATTSSDPTGPSTGSTRVYRGGSWFGSASSTRVTQRGMHEPYFRNNQTGFRLAAKKLISGRGSAGSTHTNSTAVSTTPQSINGLTWDKSTNTLRYGDNSYKMIYVEGGTFDMGATPEQGDNVVFDATPVHSVTLSGYYIGQTEVPQWLWTAVMGSNPNKFKGDNFPVHNVSWNDCYEFLRKLNDATGLNFNLPTEAQWEYAARGGKKSKGYKYSGSNNIEDVAWYLSNASGMLNAVGGKKPNELDIYDMSGNVGEWCIDHFKSYTQGSVTNPIVSSATGFFRVVRGGCGGSGDLTCCAASRSFHSPDSHTEFDGLRLVLQ